MKDFSLNISLEDWMKGQMFKEEYYRNLEENLEQFYNPGDLASVATA